MLHFCTIFAFFKSLLPPRFQYFPFLFRIKWEKLITTFYQKYFTQTADILFNKSLLSSLFHLGLVVKSNRYSSIILLSSTLLELWKGIET